ncbi:MAG: hypothetical protein HYZ14_08215 [Bacteroidetes bacterium]|nr:hypothetical protein [Bacteroidota bacterium]
MKYFFIPALLLLAACSADGEEKTPELETNVEQVISEPDHKSPNGSNTGIKPGEYFEYYPSGGVKIRGFHNDKLNREGLWISYYEEGTKWSESYYKDGKRDGHSLTFYPNGEIRYVGEYKNDQKTGTWTFYNQVGTITKEEKY